MNIFGRDFWFGLIIGFYMMAIAVGQAEPDVRDQRITMFADSVKIDSSYVDTTAAPDGTLVGESYHEYFKRKAVEPYTGFKSFEEIKKDKFKEK